MKSIQIDSTAIRTSASHTSKGNQLKWESDGWWYKADVFGYESLAECVVSHLLLHSSIDTAVIYEPILIQYRSSRYRGCRSRNFRSATEELIPLERLMRTYSGIGLAQQLAKIHDVTDKLLFTERFIRKTTGIENFGSYLTTLLEIDAFFYNEDRHTNNIAVLHDSVQNSYRLCPFFDMGLSLFSDTQEMYPLKKSLSECRSQITAKPFSRDFDTQLDATNELYGSHLRFSFPASKIISVLHDSMAHYGIFSENSTIYTTEELSRVEDILRFQARKYAYLFQ